MLAVVLIQNAPSTPVSKDMATILREKCVLCSRAITAGCETAAMPQ